jgi:hypothetical protein
MDIWYISITIAMIILGISYIYVILLIFFQISLIDISYRYMIIFYRLSSIICYRWGISHRINFD